MKEGLPIWLRNMERINLKDFPKKAIAGKLNVRKKRDTTKTRSKDSE